MVNKDFLLSLCRYYKGDKENPDPSNKLWEIESVWVAISMDKEKDFGNFLDEYLTAGLRTFNMYDDTPITLKAILYNRYMQQAEGMASIEEFKEWYNKFYKQQ
jgi:hypothetical protein